PREAEAGRGPAAERPPRRAVEPVTRPPATKRDLREEDQDEAVVSKRRRRRAERRQTAAETDGPFAVSPPSVPITLTEGLTVRHLAEKLGALSKDLIAHLLKRHGVMASINHVLDLELAKTVAGEVGVEAMQVSFEEAVQYEQAQARDSAEATTAPRAPVVTIMGHVDHGKTTLLDTIRKTRVTASEHGGITQHIGAYEVRLGERTIVFLDTPGHEAFTLMRARGARVTDIVVLVVAADDGVMPQTREAIDHARAAEVPILVAINKMDKPEANADKVKRELSDLGLTVEDWGGDTVSAAISALQGDGIPELLELILLSADLLELKARPDLPAAGVVLEARKEPGRGIVATVLVQDGSLAVGDPFVAGATWGRVRTMIDDLGERRTTVGPATPAEVAGFNDLPEAGDTFQAVEEESKARSIAEFRQGEQRRKELAPVAGKASLDQLFEQIQHGEIKELVVVLKADVQGSLEVLSDTLVKLSTDKVKVKVVHGGVGAITTNDVLLAAASNALVYGFNVRPERNARELAEKEEVELRLHTVIYELSEELRKAMTGLLDPTYEEVTQGHAEVRELFKLPRAGNIAGCHVTDGLVTRSGQVRVLRDNVVVFEGRIASLRRFKEDAAEVRQGFDCGIRLERFQDVKPGDVIESYVRQEVAATL
ncbi:MAG: translation initiation factor IF-2, partial [Thermoanaerobaculia bacterium]